MRTRYSLSLESFSAARRICLLASELERDASLKPRTTEAGGTTKETIRGYWTQKMRISGKLLHTTTGHCCSTDLYLLWFPQTLHLYRRQQEKSGHPSCAA